MQVTCHIAPMVPLAFTPRGCRGTPIGGGGEGCATSMSLKYLPGELPGPQKTRILSEAKGCARGRRMLQTPGSEKPPY